MKIDILKKLLCVLYVCTMLWCIWITHKNSGANPLSYVNSIHGSDLCEQLLEIRTLTENHESEYTVFLDDDAMITQVFSNDRNGCVYVFPAMTGIGVINATSFRGLDENEEQMTLENGIEEAKVLGKKHLIYVRGFDYEIIDIS